MSDVRSTAIAQHPHGEDAERSRDGTPDPGSLFVSQVAPERVAADANGVATANEPTQKDQEAIKAETSKPMLDTNGRVPKYDANKEGLPPRGAYCSDFGLAEGIVTKACDIVSDAYAEAKLDGYYNEAIEHVCGPAGLAGCRNPSDLYDVPGPVAALGPAGSGKSSAMNSIMSQQKVAFEHDGDDRGTYLVHEYRSATPDQISIYRVVATYYSGKDIQRDIIVYYGHVNAVIFEDSNETVDDNEGAMDQQYKTALCFFTHLLAHRKEFQSEEAAVNFFEDHGDEEPDTVCMKIYGFVEEFLESREHYHNGEERYDLNSQSALQDIFKRVCRPPRARGPKVKEGAPWPIIRKVVVHQNIQVLNAGVVLADTPGFNDLNLAVVRNTTRYLKNAGTILIFLTYRRIDQNSPLDQLLRECMALGKTNQIRLVVTLIDEMNPLDSEDLDAEERACLERAETKHKRVLSDIKETEAAKKQAKGIDSDRFVEMDSRLEKLQLLKVKAAAAVKQTTIEIRCRDMQNTLKGRIQAIYKSKYSPELAISFISNTQYQLHVNGYDPKESDPKQAPFLDLQATGVPQLRQILLAIPTQGKLENLKGLVTNRLPNILNGITGILTKSKLERIGEVRKMINKVLHKHTEPVARLVDDINQAFEKQITGTITKNLPEWRDEAQRELYKWGEMNAGTFKGFCARGGEWGTHKAYSEMRWNRDLVAVSANKLTLAFNKLDNDLESIKKDFSCGVQELFKGLCANIRDSKDAQGNVLGPFFNFVNGTAIEIADQMADELDELKTKIEQSRHAATLDVDASYFAKAMEETFKTATLLSAKNHIPKELPPPPATINGGKRKRRAKKATIGAARIDLILKKFRGENGEKSVFLTVGQLCKEDLAAFMRTWADDCNGIIEAGYGKITTYFENHFQEEEVKEDQNPVAVEKVKRLKAAAEAATEFLKTAEPHIAKCEAYEKLAI